STDTQSVIVGNKQILEREGYLYCNIKNNDLYLPEDDNWPNTIWIVDEKSHTDNRICIGVNMNDFAKKFFPSYPDSGNIYCLVDKNGKIIASDVYDMVNKSIYHYVDEKTALSNYTYKDMFNGNTAYISFDGIINDQMYLMSVTYESQYTGLLTKYYINIICICTALVISFIVIITIILYRLNKPIWKLIKDVQSLNGFTGDVSNNDIAFLEQSIYDSLDKIMDLQEQLKIRGDKLRNAQIVALQNQLNPHFIYNSLDAMNWRSMLILGEDNVVSNGIGYLSEIIAYGMDITHVTSTVKEELFITKQYIQLMKMRCGDEMRVNYSVDESLLDVRIAKLSMQPLLENSISHGFLSDMKSAQIDIDIYNDNGKLKIVIKDNGVGIEPDKLAELNKLINSDDIYVKKHIGLKNINQRVKLIYGEEYGLTIESILGEGTTCTISYPITEM
ncbi:MAG: histidine kinase, partial [Clostridia bacterium]|nr:histidine kinase [Clostridia bacterium]